MRAAHRCAARKSVGADGVEARREMHTGDVGAAGKAVAANGGHALRDVQLGDFLIVQVDLMGHVERIGVLALELDAAP